MTENTKSQTIISSSPEKLSLLGWNESFESTAAAADLNGRIARVISVQRNLFLVGDGQEEWLCAPSGRVLKSNNGDYPVTGDWVCANETVVTAVLPRSNILSRAEAGSRYSRNGSITREQPIAANIDTVLIVCGLDRDFNLRRLERYLTLVYNCGLNPVIVLTKADLHDDPEQYVMEVESIAFGVPVILSSMQDERGRSELECYLGQGMTAAMIGSSGAGKSTLANMLYGNDIQATRTVSSSVGKGRHTTTTRELIRMPQGGLLMDNPGIREIAFHEDGHGIENSFADIQELAENCRFADCSHGHEPGCAVLQAVESGELAPERLESYRKMKRELDYLSMRRNKSADRVEKERWKDITMLIRNMKK
ncbi:ribosome small subunit-dependent GTPase A [Maridesulfovibrio sp. FT414]|uniref:ribosome small subunit-dependent GTPase A n=1 Tax=Maridesulfovibrio sp. FT414 TaxID=2979469 RepID=UPI003D80A099